MATKIVHTSGKRKTAIARATLKQGNGIIRVNKILLNVYKPELAKYRIMEPLQLAGDLVNKVDIKVNVLGGGWQSQSEAVRLAIAKGLVEFSEDKNLRQTFLDYDRHLIVADIRQAESSKPNDSKPRAKRQKSYR